MSHSRLLSAAASAASAALATLVVVTAVTDARADDPKKACVAASTKGQTLRDEGKLVEARTEMLSCTREACPAVVRKHCAHWLTEIDEKLPTLVVRATGADGKDISDVRLTIDGQAVATKLDGRPLPVNPGEHVVLVEDAAGNKRQEKVLLVEGEASRVLGIRFAAKEGSAPATASAGAAPSDDVAASKTGAPEAEKPGIPVGTWVLGGVAVAAFGTFGFFASKASNSLDNLKSTCSPNCTAADTDPGRTQAFVADISLGVGAVALGGAFAWWLLSRSSGDTHAAPATTMDLRPLPGGAVIGASGAF